MKFCHWDGIERKICNENISFAHKNVSLTMKLERVLTMKIVENFVRFGMPYSQAPPLRNTNIEVVEAGIFSHLERP